MSFSSSQSLEALYETAGVLAEYVPDGRFEALRATVTYLAYTESGVAPTALRSHVPFDLDHGAAENVVYQLEAAGLIGEADVDESGLQQAFAVAELLARRPEEPSNSFLATFPNDPALDETLFDPLLSGTVELIQQAEEEVVLMSPYLSEDGYERLRGALRTARGNGADLVVITNSLTYDSDYERNPDFVNALLDDPSLAPHTSCYEYINDRTFTTFHAKVITVDGEAAYLGTANLTDTGLAGNLELGVIFRDDTAATFALLVEQLRESRFLHEVERVGEEEYRRV